MTILVTGAAGFIGSHTVKTLCENGHEVIGVDNLNTYYDQKLKKDRLRWIQNKRFKFFKLDICNKEDLKSIFERYKINKVIHLAAQAGVRYSIENPDAYIQSNIVGFMNLLELSKDFNVDHFIYASSSSVYGLNDSESFKESQKTESPASLYAATKKSNELFAHAYSHLHKMNTTALRFFTVYGEWGRPDMAPFLFTDAILKGKKIKIFNNGEMERDFTYIKDIVDGILSVKDLTPEETGSYYNVFNLGNNKPEKLLDFIQTIERITKITAKKEYLPMQKGDVVKTCANIAHIQSLTSYKPSTTIVQGLSNFVKWFKDYYKL